MFRTLLHRLYTNLRYRSQHRLKWKEVKRAREGPLLFDLGFPVAAGRPTAARHMPKHTQWYRIKVTSRYPHCVGTPFYSLIYTWNVLNNTAGQLVEYIQYSVVWSVYSQWVLIIGPSRCQPETVSWTRTDSPKLNRAPFRQVSTSLFMHHTSKENANLYLTTQSDVGWLSIHLVPVVSSNKYLFNIREAEITDSH